MAAVDVVAPVALSYSTDHDVLNSGNGNGNGSSNGNGFHTHDFRRLKMYQDRFIGYPVHLHIFEGPLDLLLHLIKEHRIDIYDIPIAEITDQYLAYLQFMEALDIELAGDFLVMAATLLMIKSKMLLPIDEDTEEGSEEESKDPREELVQRLLEYKRFKEAAETLKSLGQMRSLMFDRPPNGNGHNGHNGNGHQNGHFLVHSVSSLELMMAFREVLERVAERPAAEIPRQLLTLPMRLRHITEKLRRHPDGVTFAELCDDCDTRHAVIVTFLALLELIRRLRARVSQPCNFGEIRVVANVVTAPAYAVAEG